MISKNTAQFLLGLVNDLHPHSGAPDFPEAVAAIMRAQQELSAVLSEPEEPAPVPSPASA